MTVVNEQHEGQVRPTSDGPRIHEALGAQISRDTVTYISGAAIGFLLALISVAVTTRFLSPADYGELALLLTFAAFLTVFYNLGTLQGTFSWVFGSAGEEEVEDEGEQSATGSKRQALGTGLVTTATIAALGTVAVAALSPLLAGTLLGDSGKASLLIIAAASGAAGAIWRIVSNILRLERKPRRYVVLNTVRPILVVAAVIPLVAAGGGVEGAILGTAIGSFLSVLVGLVVTRRNFEFAMRRDDLREILRRGAIYVPIIISIWIAQNVDVYAISWFATADDVGLYRVANRVAAFLSYFSAALFMAWAPLRSTSTFQAAVKERGLELLSGRFVSYFLLLGIFLVLMMTAAADSVVRIAPPAYGAAAALIPLMGAAFLAHGLFIAVYRTSTFPMKKYVHVGAAFASAIAFLGVAPLLVPWLGAYGAAASVTVSFLVASGVTIYFAQRGKAPATLEYGRIGGALLVAGAGVGLARGLAPQAGSWQPAVELSIVVLYPVALVGLRIVTREDIGTIRRVIREVLPTRGRVSDMEDRVRELRPDAAAALEMVAVERSPAARVADSLGAQVSEIEAQLVRSLRDIGATPATDHDQRIAEYLFSELPVAERDAAVKALWSDGVDPADLHHLEQTLEGLRRLPKRTWAEARAS